MLIGHEFESTMKAIPSNTYELVVLAIIGLPILVTAGYRTFFITISGISHAYLFASKCFLIKSKHVLREQIINFVGSIITIPIFYVFHVCYVYCLEFANGTVSIPKPWWKGLGVYSHPPIFFGVS
jgi:hypothetical protein